MPKKKSVALLHKLSNLLRISLFLAKLKKPIIPNLVFLKKIRKLNKLKLLNQYSNHYGTSYVKDYEFSPSSTPLIQFRRRPRNLRVVGLRKLYLNGLLFSKCLGISERNGEKEIYSCLEMGLEEPLAFIEGGEMAIDLWDSSGEDDDCVDLRAERFIQRFYEDMRLESNL